MRLFIGFEMPAPLHEALERNLETLNNALGGRFVRPDMLHATLAFLGQVEGSQVGRAASAMERAMRDARPIACSLQGVGFFGKPGSAVLWQGFDSDGAADMVRASETLRRHLADDGFSFDPKPMRPHVTLARKVDVRGVDLASLDVATAAGTVDTVTLFHSTRIDDRLTYIPLESVILNA